MKKTSNDSIYFQISAERKQQDEQWGGPKHDDTHTPGNWAAIRGRFENRQLRAKGIEQRKCLIQIAAITVAQIESLDRQAASEEGAIEQGG